MHTIADVESAFPDVFASPQTDEQYDSHLVPALIESHRPNTEDQSTAQTLFQSAYYRRNQQVLQMEAAAQDSDQYQTALAEAVRITEAIELLEDALSPQGFVADPGKDLDVRFLKFTSVPSGKGSSPQTLNIKVTF